MIHFFLTTANQIDTRFREKYISYHHLSNKEIEANLSTSKIIFPMESILLPPPSVWGSLSVMRWKVIDFIVITWCH